MKQSGKCPKCAARRLLVLDGLNQTDGGHPSPFYVCAERLPAQYTPLLAGSFEVFVCCRCGYSEWHAKGLAPIMANLGELYPGVRVVDGDLAEAVQSLGLRGDDSAGSDGWQSFAQGVYEGVPMAIGERVRTQMTDRKTRNVMRIEVMPKARADLGTYAICRTFGNGREAPFRTVRRVGTGDSTFDGDFVTTHPCLREMWGPEPVDVEIPWLDQTMRAQLRSTAQIDEVAVVGSNVSILLDEYEPTSFRTAIELALHLARWTPPTRQPYR